MGQDIALKCSCGAVRGKALAPAEVNSRRFICLCVDCQKYAHYLEREDMLDENGGTEIIGLPPANLKITKGHEKLQAVRLTEKGPLRWYASCCRTPIANSAPKSKMPWVGLVHSCVDANDKQREQVLGPIYARIYGKYGKGKLPPGTKPKAPAGVLFYTLAFMAKNYLKKLYRPSPFFDDSGAPIAKPQTLSPAERERL